jgi:transcription elongation factor Elf1
MIYNCLKCNTELIENKNLDWDCPNCGKTFELFHAGFVEPNLREIEVYNNIQDVITIEGKKYQLKGIEKVEFSPNPNAVSLCYEPIIE